MNITNLCKENCIGCGLCRSELQTDMSVMQNGYLKPDLEATGEVENFLKNVCPVSGLRTENYDSSTVWGRCKNAYASYSTNPEIRKQASSGGVLTALAIYLLESKTVDAIIHVVVDEQNPTMTRCQVSTSKEQVVKGCGSRYSISSPWLSLSECVEENKKYAAIGKPCDISALRNLKNYDSKYNNIIYLFSFFCAGLPSKQANDNLLKQLGCDKEKCVSLTYRGNGWPGYATAYDTDGKCYQMEYSKAWGGILGREVHPYCRICIDGIGENADIACGDGWYVTTDGQPDFTERDGRNVVFTRTDAGEELYQKAVAAGVIESALWEDIKQLEIIQKYQYTRRATMQAKIKAYRLFGKATPLYDKNLMKEYAKTIGTKEKLRMYLGTVKRILQKKI